MSTPIRTLPFVLASLVASSVLFTGCSIDSTNLATGNTQSAAIKGKVKGGQQPVTGSTVTVWLAGTSDYGAGATQLASVTSDENGDFLFASNAYTCTDPTAPVYITASGGNPGGGTNANLVLAVGLGSCSSAQNALVDINEVTTAATAFALSHFFTTGLGGDYTTDSFGGPPNSSGLYNTGLVLANTYTIPNLVDLATGTVNPNTSTMTIEAAKIYSIANTIAACVNSTGVAGSGNTACTQLFTYTNPGTGAPSDTLQAAVQMALYPYNNVSALYNLAGAAPPFPGLATAPNDWTIGVSYTSPTLGLGIAGTSTSRTSTSMDIDANNLIWFPSNSATGHGLAYFDPTTLSFNGPYATALVQPQYLAVTVDGSVFGTDLANSQIVGVSTTTPGGAATSYTTTGSTGPIVAAAYSTSTTADSLIYTAGGSASGLGKTLYQEIGGTSSLVDTFVYAPNNLIDYAPPTASVDAATSGSSTACNYETNITGPVDTQASTASPCIAGGITNTTEYADGVMTTSTNQLCDFGSSTGGGGGTCFTPPVTLTSPVGIALDGDGNLWVANSGNASVSTFGYSYFNGDYTDFFQTSPIQYLHDSSNGSTLTTPYGIAIDNSGNVWVTNAGCVSTSGAACAPGSFVLSELVGAAAPTITPLAGQNDNSTQGTRPVNTVVPEAIRAKKSARHVQRRSLR